MITLIKNFINKLLGMFNYQITRKKFFTKIVEADDYYSTLMNKIKTRVDALSNARVNNIRTFVSKMKELSTKDTTIEGNLNILGSFNLLPKGSIIMFNMY